MLIYAGGLIFVVHQSTEHPWANWDALPYTALVLRLDGVDEKALRTSALAEVRAAFPDHYTHFVSGSNYVQTVAADDTAFIAQLPFYAVKPLYVAGVFLLGKLEGNYAIATAHLSALAFLFFGIFAAMARPQRVPVAIWLLGLIMICAIRSPPLSMLAAASSPDALSGTLLLGGILLARNGKLGMAALLLLSSQLARPDAIVSVLAFLLTMAVIKPQRSLLLLAVAGMAVGVRQVVTTLAVGYPLDVLMSTLISSQPYPGALTLTLGSPEYIRILIRHLGELSSNPRFLLLTLVGLSSLARSTGKKADWSAVLLLTALSNIFAHILLFPEAGGYHERFFFTSYLLILMAIGIVGIEKETSP